MDWQIEPEVNLSDTAQIVTDLLKLPALPLPAREQRLGATTVRWWEGKVGDAVIMAEGGSIEDRTVAEQVVRLQLEAHGYRRAQFTFDGDEELRKTAHWTDIMAKAKRLIQSGNVTVLRNGWNNVAGHVIGDHGEYNTEIGRDDPSSRTITTWHCECPWDQYAWQRTRKWKKYEGRPCAHVMALYWKSLATPLDDYDPEQHGPMTPGQKQGPPGPPPGAPPPEGPEGQVPTAPPEVPSAPPVPTGPSGMQPPTPPGPPGAQAPLAPPGAPGVLPPSPMEQLQMLQPPAPGMTPGGMPSPPGSVSVPGAKMPSPFNPMQWPDGTYSSAPEDPPNYRKGTDEKHCGGCKMAFEGKCWGYGNKPIEQDHVCDSFYPEGKESKVAAGETDFQPSDVVYLKDEGYGTAIGKSEEHGAGMPRSVPAGTRGEVMYQDPTTGWIEVLFPIAESGPMEPYEVQMFCEPSDLQRSRNQNEQDVWIQRKT